MSQNVTLIQHYFDALAKGDFQTVGSLFSDDLVWHQPGHGTLSGVHKGKEAVFAHLAKFSMLSKGTFTIDRVDYITANKDLVIASIHFNASAKGGTMNMKGIDLFRVEGAKIQEVWLFSEDIETEDRFWTDVSM